MRESKAQSLQPLQSQELVLGSNSVSMQGMQPYVLSREASKLGKGWAQGGVNLGLIKKELRYEYL